ncbi:MAG: hypothetical protein QXM16_09245, partial [Nitrososphaerota archaeon]
MVRVVRLAGEKRYMVGPFDRWVFRGEYARLVVPEDERGKLAGLGTNFLDAPIRKIRMAYIDRHDRVWLLISSGAHDLVKHFTGVPEARR